MAKYMLIFKPLKIKKTTWQDPPHAPFQMCSICLIKPHGHIFSQSLLIGIIPSKNEKKMAKVAPIFKSKNASDINNYRPISLQSMHTTFLEKLFRQNLHTISISTNPLHNSSSILGLQIQLSTPWHFYRTKLGLPLMTKKFYTVIMFYDFRKVFDTCKHVI